MKSRTRTTSAVGTVFRCWGRKQAAAAASASATGTTTITRRISTFSSTTTSSTAAAAAVLAAKDISSTAPSSILLISPSRRQSSSSSSMATSDRSYMSVNGSQQSVMPTIAVARQQQRRLFVTSSSSSLPQSKHTQQCSSFTTMTTMMMPSVFNHHYHHPPWIVIPGSVKMMKSSSSFSTTTTPSSTSKRRRRKRQRKKTTTVVDDDGQNSSSNTTWSTTSSSSSPSNKKKGARTRRRRRKGTGSSGSGSGSSSSSSSSESRPSENTTATKNSSNNTSINKEVTPSSPREEHERKVAAMQARILQQQKQPPAPPRQPSVPPFQQSGPSSSSSPSMVVTPAPSTGAEKEGTILRPTATGSSNNSNDDDGGRFTPDEMNILINTIHHWLSKNPEFFHSTMEALDLKSLNQNQNQQKNVDNGIHGSQSQKNHPNNVDNHPLKVVYNQYRRLYYDSIPDFRDEIGRTLQNPLLMNGCSSSSIGDPTSTSSAATATVAETETNNDKDNSLTSMSPLLLQSLDELKDAGFADPTWSKSFRHVRGYQINRESLSKHHSRQLRQIQLRQDELREERERLRNMEEMDQLLKMDSDDDYDSDSSLSSQKPFGGEKRNKSNNKKDNYRRNDNKSLDEDQQDQTSTNEQSFVQQALGMFSWIWSPKDVSVSTNREGGPETKSNTNRNDDESARVATAIKKQKRDQRLLQQSKRLQKRIDRKYATIRQLEDNVNEAIAKLDEVTRTLEELQSPMSDEEYAAGREVLARTKESICSAFAQYISNRHTHLIDQYQALETKTDLTKPHEWYGHARLDKRKIIFHGGPTNSGKTYNALQRLKEAEQGLYLGPLRLLAAEIYETLTADAVYTNLYTGQERRDVAFSTHASATVEMASFENEYDVVVIDEIQMIADTTRGAAWTKALLGLRCKEIHVCGGMEAKDIVEKLARDCGDDFEVNEYDRFSKLVVSKKSLASDPKSRAYRNVMPGDCIVAFSRNDIFAIKREIENSTGYKCSVVYGKLPPEVRAEQARKFNDPNSDHEVLVASDAIGMGLNLNIRRIIFNSVFKFNGDEIVRLSHSEIKQIAGRAGRRNSPYPNGEVTSRDPRDLSYIRDCLTKEIQPVEKAAILPTAAHIEQFSEALSAYQLDDQDTFDLHDIFSQFSSMATVKGDFFLGRQHELSMIAKHIRNVPLTLKDAYTLCLSPTNETSLGLLESFAMKYARRETSGLPSRPVPKPAKSFDDLSHLCSIYSDADLFLWLQWKFPPSNAMEQAAAMAKKEKTLRYINQALLESDKLKLEHDYLQQAQRHRKSWESVNGPSEKIGPGFSELDEDYDSDGRDNDFYGDDIDEEDNRGHFVYS